jgi:hypothetical protein
MRTQQLKLLAALVSLAAGATALAIAAILIRDLFG